MFRKKTQRDQVVEARRRRQTQNEVQQDSTPKHHNKWFFGLFTLFFLLSILICFLGQSSTSNLFRPDQIANIHVIAEFPFEYESSHLKTNLIESQKKRVAPVYRIDLTASKQFEDSILQLQTALEAWQLENRLKGEPKPATVADLQPILDKIKHHNWTVADLVSLVNLTQPEERKRLFEESILTLKDILRNGVYSPQDAETLFPNKPLMVNLDIQGLARQSSIQSDEDALRNLRINITSMNPNPEANPEITRSIYRLIKPGLQPNLIFDKEATEAKIAEAAKNVKPVIVSTAEGQPIIKQGTRITRQQLETLEAYKKEVQKRDVQTYGVNAIFWQNTLISFGLMICAAIFCNTCGKQLTTSPRRLGLTFLIIIGNLILMRGMNELVATNIVIGQWKISEILIYASPVGLGAFLGTIILGSQVGLLISLLTSIFWAMMHGYSLEVFTVSLLTNAVILHYCRDIRFRAKVVKAGAIAGLTTAATALILGFMVNTPWLLVLEQCLAATVIGLSTGVLAVGILPLIEQTFKFTTDIKLLELTDFNHPLLRRMQMSAPGSYHHSLMVANLAERAAASIHANSLQCRVTALFHDIGKMVKPDYFTENQRNGVNPHGEKIPSMSALIIKSHVKEGVVMARQHHLPEVIIDAIEQHHGTGLIWYFYHRAKQARESQTTQTTRDPFPIDETTYRYEGPRPQTRENAILLLSDCVEAASRSLKKPSAPNIQELVDKIFKTNIDDGQLDEAPITMEELHRVKESLVFTLLNTLHHRTEYPERDGGQISGTTDAPPSNTPAVNAELVEAQVPKSKFILEDTNQDI